MQENTGRQLNEICKTIEEQNEKFHKEIEAIIIIIITTENLELKNTTGRVKNAVESFKDWFTYAEERISTLRYM